MSEIRKIGYGKSVGALLGVLVGFLAVTDYLILSYQRTMLREQIAEHARHELDLVGTLSREALLKRDYVTVRTFLHQFAKEQDEIRLVKAVTPQQFVLAEYRDPRPVSYPLAFKQDVGFEGTPLIELAMIKDLSGIERTLHGLTLRLIAISVLLSSALGLTLWGILKAMAIRPLEQEIVVRRQAEEQARQSETRLRQLCAATFEGVGVVREGKVIDVNPQIAAMLGYQVSEVIGRRVEELVAPKSRHMVMKNIEAEHEGRYEYVLLHRDGTEIPCESQSRMMDWQGDKARVTIIRDLTERKKAEALIRESEERLRTINNNLASGMIYQAMAMLDGTRRFTYLSDNVKRFYGVTPAEGMADANLIYGRVHEEDRLRLRHEEEAAIRNLSTFRSEVRMLGPDGVIRWSYFVSAPRKLDDGSICWDGIEFDITERKETELLLSRKNKMESLGTLAAGIAHDFNNVLHIVRANLEIASRETGTPSLQQALAVIAECEQRGAALVRQILRFSRREAGERQPMDLAQLVRETVQLLMADSRFAHVVVEQHIGAEPVPFLADDQEIRQLVGNLMINACQAVPGREGRIAVTLATEEYSQGLPSYDGVLKPGRYHRLTIADNGCGMDEATLARLFEPFFTTRENAGGTGLGLSIVHGVVRSHEGGITVRSMPGMGTTFNLYFPCVEGVALAERASAMTAGSPLHPREAALGAGTGRRLSPPECSILFVDDEVHNTRNWSELLVLEGFAVRGFTSGEEALAAFRQGPETYSLLLTDLRMTGMTGCELARAVRRIRPDLPVLFSTGWVDKETESFMRDLGNCAILAKPYNVETLVKAILASSRMAGCDSTPVL